MSRETYLWKNLRDAARFFPVHINRIENAVMSGMPDVEGYMKGFGQFWFELKVAKRPVRAATPVRFKVRPAQVAWMKRRAELGAKAYWLVQVGSGADRSIYVIGADRGPQLAKGIPESEIESLAIRGGLGAFHNSFWAVQLFEAMSL